MNTLENITSAGLTAGSIGYLINNLLAMVGAAHLSFEELNLAGQTFFLFAGGIMTLGWMGYRFLNERQKYLNDKHPKP